MSDGDEDAAAESGADAGDEPAHDVETFETRLDDAATALESAETESDLDDVEATLDDVESDLEAADLPEPDDDEDGEDAADPGEELESRLADLRDDLEAARGPYAEDAAETARDAASTIGDEQWTDAGEDDLGAAVEAFLDDVDAALAVGVDTDAGETPADFAAAVDDAADGIDAVDLDPDDDAETVADLVEAAETLSEAVDAAQTYDDLTVREKLRVEGFYEALGQKHKDYPPEWTALREWEDRGNAEMILLLLDLMGDSEFMERHCLDALERMGHPDALDPMLDRAARRDEAAISVLGKIGDDAALDQLHEFLDADPGLQRVTLRAIGEIGSRESTQPAANLLAADDESVRSQAARTLGLIGDARAVDPLADVLADDTDTVRASAAWALVQIGTRDALEAAAEHADDRSYIVQAEAERAADALDDAPAASV